MDCLQQFMILEVPNTTSQKIDYFQEHQHPQSTEIGLQDELPKEFYLFETTPLETILELEPEEHHHSFESNDNFYLNHAFSNENQTTGCVTIANSPLEDVQKNVRKEDQYHRTQFQPYSFESLITTWKITTKIPCFKTQRVTYPEIKQKKSQNDQIKANEVSRRKSKRRTGGTRSDPLSPSAENFRLEIGKYKISILVLRHQGNHGCNPKDPTLFYYQARIRNMYPQRHLWAGWEV